MTSVDNRIVEMEFRDSDFTPGVRHAIDALKNLKDALSGATQANAFNEISRSASDLRLDNINRAVSTIESRFSNLGIIGVAALANIANKAVGTGMQLVKSLSLDQVTAGFSEYELKMGSVQTILANAKDANGMAVSLDQVMERLEDLNSYADKTIYSFSDMTSNIGKFTNAGVDLDTAVAAIQGISNEAAVSGANAQEASRAMYNFAQALSAGYVKLIDWKSIENANMATVEFKQQLIDTAVAMGTLKKEGDQYVSTTTDMQGKVSQAFDATSNFNDSLSAQWMTAEEKAAYEERLRGIGYTEDQIKAIEELGVKAFASAQDVKSFSQMMDTIKEAIGSGWGTTFELIFGNFEEAKQLWTSLSKAIDNAIGPIADFRNGVLKLWHDLGGRQALIEGIANAFRFFGDILAPIRDGFAAVFPGMESLGTLLARLSEKFKSFTETLKVSSRWHDILYNLSRGLASMLAGLGTVFVGVLGVAIKLLGGLWKVLSPIFTLVGRVAGFFAGLIANLYNFLYVVDETNDGLTGAKRALRDWKNALAPIGDLLSAIAKSAKSFFVDSLKTAASKVKAVAKAFKDWFKSLEPVHKAVDILTTAVSKSKGEFKAFVDRVGEVGPLQAAREEIGRLKSKFDELAASDSLLGKILRTISSFATMLSGFARSAIEFGRAIKDNVISVLKDSGLLDALKQLWEGLKDFDPDKFTEGLAKAGAAIKSIVENIIVPAVVDGLGSLPGKIQSIFEGDFLGSLMDSVAEFFSVDALAEKFSGIGKDISDKGIVSSFLDAVGNLWNGIAKALGLPEEGIDWTPLKNLITGFKDPLGYITSQAKVMFSNTALALSEFASQMLTSVSDTLTDGDILDNAKQVLKLVAGAELIGLMDSCRRILNSVSGLATSVKGAFSSLGGMFKNIGKTFTSLGHAFDAFAVIELAVAIFIMARALKEIADIPQDDLVKAGVAIGVMFAAVVGALLLLNKMTAAGGGGAEGPFGAIKNALNTLVEGNMALNLLAMGAAVMAVAGAVYILAKAVKSLSEMSGKDLLKGVGSAVVILAAIGGLIFVMGKSGSGVLALGAGALMLAASVKILISAFKDLDQIRWKSIIKGSVLLGEMVLAMGVLSHMSGGIGKGSGLRLMGVAGALLMVAAGMKIIVMAFEQLDQISWGDFLSSLAKFAIILVALLGTMTVLSMFSKNALGMAATAGVILAIGASIAIMVAALKVLSGINPDSLWTAVKALGAAMLVFGAMVVVMGLFPEAAVAAGAFALLIASIAGAAIVMAIAFKIIASLGDNAFDGLANSIKSFVELTKGIDWGAVAGIGAGLAVLGIGVALLGTGVILLGAGLIVLALGIDMISMIKGDELDGLAQAIQNFVSTVSMAEIGKLFVAALMFIVLGAALIVLAVAGAFIAIALTLVGLSLIVLAKGLDVLSGVSTSTLDNFNTIMKDAQIGTMFAFGAGAIVCGIGIALMTVAIIAFGLLNLKNLSVLNEFVKSADPLKMAGIGLAAVVLGAGLLILGAALVIFGAGLTLIGAGLTLIGTGLESLMTGLTSVSTNLGTVMQSIVDGFHSFTETLDISDIGSKLISSITNGAYSSVGELAGPAWDAISEFAGGILDNLGIAGGTAPEIIGEVMEALGIEVPSLDQVGADIMEWIKSGIDDFLSLPADKATEALDGVEKAGEGFKDCLKGIGGSIVDGLASGIRGRAETAAQEAASAIGKIVAAAKAAADVNSPSKVMMREVGFPLVEGLEVGMERRTKMAESAARTMVNHVTDAASNALTAFDSTDPYKYSSMSPVIDFDTTENLKTEINSKGLFADRSFQNAVDAMNDQNGTFTDANIVAELQALRKDVSALQGNNYNLSMNGVTINDKDAMAQATEDYLLALSRIGGMNFG